MDDSPNVPESSMGMYDGPYRETAKKVLERRIAECRRKLNGYEQLLKIVERAESGSPLEETMWEMLVALRN